MLVSKLINLPILLIWYYFKTIISITPTTTTTTTTTATSTSTGTSSSHSCCSNSSNSSSSSTITTTTTTTSTATTVTSITNVANNYIKNLILIIYVHFCLPPAPIFLHMFTNYNRGIPDSVTEIRQRSKQRSIWQRNIWRSKWSNIVLMAFVGIGSSVSII